MFEVIFLWTLALIYILFAVVQDIKTKEICNWISFSLIIFALVFRFFYSLFEGDNFTFFYMGLIGLGIFFLLGNLFYYSRVFAGGDAKLMISLGPVLPYSALLFDNFNIFVNFLLIFFATGVVYTIFGSVILCFRNFGQFKKEFSKQLKQNKKMICVALLFSILFLLLGFLDIIFIAFGVLIFFTSYLYIYAKAVDEACMIRKIKTEKLREGDWLYSDVKIGRNTIKAKWDGVTKKEIAKLKKKFKEIRIREGIPFSPVFLISFLIFIILFIINAKLWNPFWQP